MCVCVCLCVLKQMNEILESYENIQSYFATGILPVQRQKQIHSESNEHMQQENQKSLYEQLNVSENATPREIRLGYLRKAKIDHPDKLSKNTESSKNEMHSTKQDNNNSAEKNTTKKSFDHANEFLKTKEAYDILSDVTRRAKYNEERQETLQRHEKLKRREELRNKIYQTTTFVENTFHSDIHFLDCISNDTVDKLGATVLTPRVIGFFDLVASIVQVFNEE